MDDERITRAINGILELLGKKPPTRVKTWADCLKDKPQVTKNENTWATRVGTKQVIHMDDALFCDFLDNITCKLEYNFDVKKVNISVESMESSMEEFSDNMSLIMYNLTKNYVHWENMKDDNFSINFNIDKVI